MTTRALPRQNHTLSPGFKRFLRTMAVGGAVMVLDFTVLEILVRFFQLAPSVAKVPAFLLCVAVQFWANRTFAFHAQRGGVGGQLVLYALSQCVALGLTVALLHVLHLYVSLELANLIAGTVVFYGFCYPVWARIFRVPPKPPVTPDPTAPGPAAPA